jgi:hypothetical protein
LCRIQTLCAHVVAPSARGAQLKGIWTMSNANPGSVREALLRVEAFLHAGQPGKAIEFIVRCRVGSAELTNAYGVCLMRAGELDKAIDVFQGLCLSGSVCFKTNVSALHMANYATALLLKGNVSGGVGVLRQTRDQSHPAVRRLLSAVARWRGSLSWIERLRMVMSGRLQDKPVELGGEPGEVMDDADVPDAPEPQFDRAREPATVTSAVD